MICKECGNSYFSTILDGHFADMCPECYDMNENNSGHGFAERDEDERDDRYDDENDADIERQELEDFDETDEAYGHYGDNDDDMYGSGAGWDDRGQDDFFGDDGY